ncbi:PE domain-containing protein, partial [Mycobacterium tuberculosis]
MASEVAGIGSALNAANAAAAAPPMGVLASAADGSAAAVAALFGPHRQHYPRVGAHGGGIQDPGG